MAAAVAAFGAVIGVGATLVVSPAGYVLFEYGCGDSEEDLGEALAADAVLDVAPDGAGEKESYESCDDDDLFVVAGHSYTYDGTHEAALAHYREAAQAGGWRQREGDCFSKEIDGTDAYLTVDGPADGSLAVEIVAARESLEDWAC